MKKLEMMALLTSAVLFTGLGVTSLYAKCGDSIQKPVEKSMNKQKSKCGTSAEKSMKNTEKSMDKQKSKCGDSADKDMKKYMKQKDAKCGVGKCS